MSSKDQNVPQEYGYPKDWLILMNESGTRTLRAKLYNLVDSVLTDEKQAKAVKGLIKDFTASVHYELNGNIIAFLKSEGIMKDEELGPSMLEYENTPLS